MKRIGFVLSLTLGVWSAASSVVASHPDLLRHYRFLPGRSVLHQSWTDREAPTIPIPISGTFDLVTGFHHEPHHDPDPWVGQFAKFENVHAGGPHPIQDYIVDLDEVLNLSGLDGRQLPAAFIGTLFGFEGQTADGSDVRLLVSLIGPWLSMRGETTPPEGSGLMYSIDAVARHRPWADFNDDGVVDGADLARLTANLGATGLEGDATAFGDADGNGNVDGADYLTWQQQLGLKSPAVGVALAAAVPEPASLAVLAAGVVVLIAGVACPRPRGHVGIPENMATSADLRGHAKPTVSDRRLCLRNPKFECRSTKQIPISKRQK